MMKQMAFILLLLAQMLIAHCQTLDDLSKNVVFLRHTEIETRTIPEGTFELWLKKPNTNAFFPATRTIDGTGFLVAYANKLYLVTARHVAKAIGFEDNDIAVFDSKEGKPFALQLKTLRGSNTNGWIHHDKVDVSILGIEPPPSLMTNELMHHFLMADNLDMGTNSPSRDAILTVMGFPLSFGWGVGATDFSPISLQTRAASGFLQNGTCFLLQDPSVQGYSGAPVYKISHNHIDFGGGRIVGPEDPVVCFGVVSGTFPDDTGGKLAAVTPISFVLELIHRN